ncbi:hypothetical protein BJV82DRAFT_412718 [Fennellomyces sp. T-0311]|nr:hypothetical protein BJV82DRAFT_412718 [Fennellomyces sp. T-0311]
MSSATDFTHSSTSLRLAQQPTDFQLGTLTRIVKAQVILLATNLTQDNYSKINVQIKTLIDTHGQVIRQHLVRFLLVHIYKQDTSGKPGDTPPLLLLKETVQATSDSTPFTTFAETLCAFCKSDSAPLVDLEYLLSTLGLDAFQQFALSSLLLLSGKQSITDQEH